MKKWLELFAVGALLALGFGARLYKINNPIADWHSWRQADTAAVTRNFVKYGVNPFLPRYDDMSDVSGKGFNPDGYRLVEFPLFNLVHFAAVKFAPFKSLEFWGRMVSTVASLFSGLFIYLLVKKHASTAAGLVSMAVFLLMPFNIYFSRVVLPDPLMVTVALAALVAWDRSAKWAAYLLGAIAVLVKPTAVFLLLPLLFAWRWGIIFLVGPFILWRMWQQQYPVGVPGSDWLLNGDHIRFKGAFFRWIFGDRLGRLILGYWGTWPATTGVLNLPKQLWWLVGGAVLYLFTFATGNVRHDYYQIPIMPAVAVLVGVGVVALWKAEETFLKTWAKRGLVAVAMTFMLAFGWYEVRGNYQINNPAILDAGQAADRLLPKDAVVIADYNGDTAFLYQTNRKGFPNIPYPLEDLMHRFGVNYYISTSYNDQTNQIMAKYQVVEQTPGYVIVKLQ
ncbi:MAG: glycosyltransferase family 39 protein [bacterium]|nr:glycosyltransferase family 39 protein [bacterium]